MSTEAGFSIKAFKLKLLDCENFIFNVKIIMQIIGKRNNVLYREVYSWHVR